MCVPHIPGVPLGFWGRYSVENSIDKYRLSEILMSQMYSARLSLPVWSRTHIDTQGESACVGMSQSFATIVETQLLWEQVWERR